ncbi:MAG: DUF3866 family protein [Limnochordaceae bacterium]|nr:DUF3866 family protein [Limnochordaceae bacterium]
MIELRVGVVHQVVGRDGDRVDLVVRIDGQGAAPSDEPGFYPAYALTQLGYGGWYPGQRVLVNTSAVSLSLGSGGYHVVVAPLDPPRPPGDWRTPALRRRLHGHIVKLRYTPLQTVVRAAEEPGSPYHRALRRVTRIDGLPVAVLALHGMLTPLVAALRWVWGEERRPRVAYVMTDATSLAAASIRTLGQVRRARLIDLLITAGQALGGDLEAVHPASALAMARLAGCDVALVGPGPGTVGTATPLGTTALEQAYLADLVTALGGTAVVPLRISQADARMRHRGVSHHDRIALGQLAGRPATVVMPARLPRALRRLVVGQLAAAGILRRHRVVQADPLPARPALERLPFVPRTMGRDPAADPAFFDGCLAAGMVLARLSAARGDDSGAVQAGRMGWRE